MGLASTIGGCCRCAGALAVIPLAVVIAALVEKPQILKVPEFAHSIRSEANAKIISDSDARESTAAGVATSRLGSGRMFDRIAFAYDSTNKWMSLGLDQVWRTALVQDCLQLEAGDRALDLGTGTADVGLLVGERLKQLGNGVAATDAVLGVDPSIEMLRRGVSKVERKGLQGSVRLVKGDAQDLSQVQNVDAAGTTSELMAGVADDSIDKISMSFGVRNVPDRARALSEMRRVLTKRPQSRVCILEFSLPDGAGFLEQTARLFITRVVPFIGNVATLGAGSEEYEYLEKSILRFPKPMGFAEEMARAGLPVKTITQFAYGAVNLYTAGIDS